MLYNIQKATYTTEHQWTRDDVLCEDQNKFTLVSPVNVRQLNGQWEDVPGSSLRQVPHSARVRSPLSSVSQPWRKGPMQCS